MLEYPQYEIIHPTQLHQCSIQQEKTRYLCLLTYSTNSQTRKCPELKLVTDLLIDHRGNINLIVFIDFFLLPDGIFSLDAHIYFN